MTSKTLGQKIFFGLAMLFYLAAAAAGVGLFLYEPASPLDPILASLIASVIFFAGSGFAFYTVATARLKGLLALKGEGDPPGHP